MLSLRIRLLSFVLPSLLAMFISMYFAISYIVEHEVELDAAVLADKHLEAVKMLHEERVLALTKHVAYLASIPMFKAIVAEHSKQKVQELFDNGLLTLPSGVEYAVYDNNNQLLKTSSDLFQHIPNHCHTDSLNQCQQIIALKQDLYQFIEVEIKSGTHLWGHLAVMFLLSDNVLIELQNMTEFCEISLINAKQNNIFSSTLDLKSQQELQHISTTLNFADIDSGMLSFAPTMRLNKRPYVMRAVPLYDTQNHTTAYLLIHQSLESVDNILKSIGRFFALVGMVLLLVIVCIDIILVKNVLKPLNSLVMSIASMKIGDKKLSVETSNTKEVDYLLKAINRMLQAIFDKTAQLSRSERQYKSLITHANDAIISVNEHQKICVWNQQAEALFGYSEKEACLLSITHLFPTNPSIMDDKKSIALATNKQGHAIPVEISVTQSLSVADEILYTAVINDLSAEIKARERDQLLLQAIHHSSDMIMITDCHATIEYVNPALEKMTGYTAHELIGQAACVFNSGKHDTAFYDDMWATIRRGDVWQGKLINQRKDAAYYTEEMSISPVFSDDKVLSHFVAIKRDISEQEKLEEQLEHSQRLESLGILAGGIAHDFNNLLTAIMGTASLLRFQLEGEAQACSMLDRIEQSSQRAADLCKQMLAYSGKGKFEIVPVNLSQLVSSLLDLLNVSIDKGIHMQLNLAEDLPLIDADVAQIQQIIMNLIINASEAIDNNHGLIRVETGEVYANQEMLNTMWLDESLKEGRYIYLDVADNGCGMSDKVQKKIFDPFFTTKFTGRGLGMSAILGIVRGHHGAIRIQSEEGSGTTFTVLLPVQEIPVLEKQSKLKPEAKVLWRGRGTVLLVDDEEVIRKVVSAMLSNMGFEILLACNGHQALEIYQEHATDIDLVLLDLTMPVMDGITCFKALRLKNKTLKVLISSGYSSQEIGTILNNDTYVNFIQKPYIMQALRDKLQVFLGNP